MDNLSKIGPDNNELDDSIADIQVADHTRIRASRSDSCTICLDSISERAVAVPCNHLTFDFLCLVSWLQEQPRCPLCNAVVTAVQYDWRAPDDFKTYHVLARQTDPQLILQRSEPNQTPSHFSQVPRRAPLISRSAVLDPALEQRRHVYRNRLYSLRVGSNPISRYRDLTAQEFSQSPELQSRAKTFLRRELQIFPFLDSATRRNDRDFFVQYTMAVLRKYEVKGADGEAEELVARFLGNDNARLILHELEAWLRSPFASLAEWDRHVQYHCSSDSHK